MESLWFPLNGLKNQLSLLRFIVIATAANVRIAARCWGKKTGYSSVLATVYCIHLPPCIGPRIWSPATLPGALHCILFEPSIPLGDAEGFMAFAHAF
jgi:hypothetical protein